MCHLKKWEGFEGYGFNLHHHQDLDKHTIGKIDDESPARITGMIEGDYIVEVNGVNVEVRWEMFFVVVDKMMDKIIFN